MNDREAWIAFACSPTAAKLPATEEAASAIARDLPRPIDRNVLLSKLVAKTSIDYADAMLKELKARFDS